MKYVCRVLFVFQHESMSCQMNTAICSTYNVVLYDKANYSTYWYILIGSYLRSFRGETHSYVDVIINIHF